MDRNRLTKIIFGFFRQRKTEKNCFEKRKSTWPRWGRQNKTAKRDKFRQQINEFRGFNRQERTGGEQKKEVSEKM